MADFDAPDEEEKQIVKRRLFTYSPQAIRAAVQVDRLMVNYPAFSEAITATDRVFQLGKELTVQQGIMITGETGSGKTSLARYFLKSLPQSDLFEEGYGAVAIRLSSRPTVGHVIGALLRKLRYPFPSINAQTLDLKRQVLIDALRQKGTRLILVDEAHHLLAQAQFHGKGQTVYGNVTDVLRELMDETPLAIVLLGVPELKGVGEVDSHLANRIGAHFELRGLEAPRLWHGFVRGFVKLQGSSLLDVVADQAGASKLYAATQGNLRAFKRLITEAVLVAVDENVSVVSQAHLRMAHERVTGQSPARPNPYA